MRFEPAVPAQQEAPDPVRVVVDARPIQEPERSPLTAWYLEHLLSAFAHDPVDGESFVLVSRSLRPDPSVELAAAGLPVAASRRIPPTTRALRSAGMTLDSFLLRGAELGARGNSATVFHTAGGAVPLASQLPVVATLLDLAPWELPDVYAATSAARFGHRVRARVLRDAARVIVCSRAVAEAARRHLHIPIDRISVIPLAVGDDFMAAVGEPDRLAADRARLALPPRYLVYAGRYDARKDLRTLLRALAELKARGAKRVPTIVVALDVAFPDDHARVGRAVESAGLTGAVTITSTTGARQRAAVIAGADAFIYPALTDATAVPVLEALVAGAPVIATNVGALPEAVGSAGIVVEPRDPARMAAALEAMWADGPLARQLRDHAVRRAASDQRTWRDIATETRHAYASAAGTPASTRHAHPTRSGLRRFALR
jgi:glycosyltransferase involved in cell wall biosynthesis